MRTKSGAEVSKIIEDLVKRYRALYGEVVPEEYIREYVDYLIKERKKETIAHAFSDETTETLIHCADYLKPKQQPQKRKRGRPRKNPVAK